MFVSNDYGNTYEGLSVFFRVFSFIEIIVYAKFFMDLVGSFCCFFMTGFPMTSSVYKLILLPCQYHNLLLYFQPVICFVPFELSIVLLLKGLML